MWSRQTRFDYYFYISYNEQIINAYEVGIEDIDNYIYISYNEQIINLRLGAIEK